MTRRARIIRSINKDWNVTGYCVYPYDGLVTKINHLGVHYTNQRGDIIKYTATYKRRVSNIMTHNPSQRGIYIPQEEYDILFGELI